MSKGMSRPSCGGPGPRGPDPHPCALNHRAPPAKVLVIQAGLARGGGWGRLTRAVMLPGKAKKKGGLKISKMKNKAENIW